MGFQYVSQGDKFRPNAKKENALSRLLNGVSNISPGNFFQAPEERSVSLAINVSGDVIPAGSPVELVKDPEGESASLIETPAILVTKKKNGSSGLWGIALEELQAGALGPVQLHGVSICTEVQGEKLDFVDANENGFFYSNSGAARVLKSNAEEKSALVFLGGDCGYDGFFAVQFDGETFSVVDGGDPDSSIAGYYYFNGQSRSARKSTGISPAVGWLCLKDNRISSGGTFEIYTGGIPNKPEKKDEDDYHPIALITKKGESWSFRQISKWEIPQLWTFEDCEDD